MKVELRDGDKLLIVPESAFESKWLYENFKQGVTHKAFVRTGFSLSDRLGLMVMKNDEPDEPV